MIESRANAQVKKVCKLNKSARYRKQERCFAAEGFKMVEEALRYGEVRMVYVSEAARDEYEKKLLHKMKDTGVEWVSEQVFREMSDTATPQGVLALVEMPEYRRDELAEAPGAAFICLEDIRDPGNMGTIFRTALGAGMTAAVLSGQCVDLFHPKVVRATMGALFRMPFYVVSDMAEEAGRLRRDGFTVYAAGPDTERDYTSCSFQGKTGILIGNEANGLRPETFEQADERIVIPMEGGLESLNAAVSAALLMYEVRRKRTADA